MFFDCRAFFSLVFQDVVSNIFKFHPYLGKIPILTCIFFRWVETTTWFWFQTPSIDAEKVPDTFSQCNLLLVKKPVLGNGPRASTRYQENTKGGSSSWGFPVKDLVDGFPVFSKLDYIHGIKLYQLVYQLR